MERDLDSSVAHLDWPMSTYIFGAGPIEVRGVMKSYNQAQALRTVKVPTLLTVGRYDYTSEASAITRD